MRAALLHGIRDLRLGAVPDPVWAKGAGILEGHRFALEASLVRHQGLTFELSRRMTSPRSLPTASRLPRQRVGLES